MSNIRDKITCTERDFLWEQIGALKSQVAIYREWLMSLGAIQPTKIINFDKDNKSKK